MTTPLTADELSTLADDEGVQPAGLGARAASEIERLRKIAAVANLVGQHLRDQDGVNAQHLDELAAVTAPDGEWTPPPRFRVVKVERPAGDESIPLTLPPPFRALDVSKLSELERKAPIVIESLPLFDVHHVAHRVEIAVDAALGEVSRQTGGTMQPQLMREARGAGIAAGSTSSGTLYDEPAPELPDVYPSQRVRWRGREWTVAMVNANPGRGHYALEFVERVHGDDETMLRAADEVTLGTPANWGAGGWQNLEPRSYAAEMRRAAMSTFAVSGTLDVIHVRGRGSDGEQVTAFAAFVDRQASMLDDACCLILSHGYTADECEIVREYVSALGERTVIRVRGDEVFEMVTTSPGMQTNPNEQTVTFPFTITPRWLTELVPC